MVGPVLIVVCCRLGLQLKYRFHKLHIYGNGEARYLYSIDTSVLAIKEYIHFYVGINL
jgi:hypothetical protein